MSLGSTVPANNENPITGSGESSDDENRRVLDDLIPQVSHIVDKNGGICALNVIMADVNVVQTLKRIPEGYDRKLTKILKHYSDYFALLDNGFIATFLGYESGNVDATMAEFQKKKSGLSNVSHPSAAHGGGGGLGSVHHGHHSLNQNHNSLNNHQLSNNNMNQQWGGSLGSSCHNINDINSMSNQNQSNQPHNLQNHDPKYYYDRLNTAANNLWRATYNHQDEDSFLACLNEVHAARREIWEKKIRCPTNPPNSYGSSNYNNGNQNSNLSNNGLNQNQNANNVSNLHNLNHLSNHNSVGTNATSTPVGPATNNLLNVLHGANNHHGSHNNHHGSSHHGVGSGIPGSSSSAHHHLNNLNTYNQNSSMSHNTGGLGSSNFNGGLGASAADAAAAQAAVTSGPAAAAAAVAGIGTTATTITFDPDERDLRMRKLKELVVSQLAEAPNQTLALPKLSQDAEIARLKKGVVAKFQKWLQDNMDTFDVLEDPEGKRPPNVQLILRPDRNGQYHVV